ncbi:unnamed protein product [Blepharisma stoltei]|uniref:NADH dehydrogenase subunit 4L n=1 Tax=Blepharisma stoltei TaxID=1481888 RepID=A0AAU9JWJ7_9CILI|nr:unnamed protein product [Blepharisma stoltei]
MWHIKASLDMVSEVLGILNRFCFVFAFWILFLFFPFELILVFGLLLVSISYSGISESFSIFIAGIR